MDLHEVEDVSQPRLPGGLAAPIREIEEPADQRGPWVLLDPAEGRLEILGRRLPPAKGTVGGHER
jgi:hypothetical protein